MKSGTNTNRMVFFCFRGGGDGISAPDVTMSLPWSSLQDVYPSLLTSLADDKWKSDPTVGLTKTQPIIVKPLQMSDQHWSPGIVDMIRDYHINYSTMDNKSTMEISPGSVEPNGDTQMKKVPVKKVKLAKGIELEDALEVFNYCGLKVEDDPGSYFDFSEVDTPARLRSKLYLNRLDFLARAVQDIVAALDCNPRRLTPFVFLMHHHEINEINRLNSGVVFAAMRDEQLFEFFKEEENRNALVVALQEDHGLKSEFQCDGHRYLSPHRNSVDDRDRPNLPEGCCLVAVRDDDERGGGYGGYGCGRYHKCKVEALSVLEVIVPESPSAMKRQRLSW